MSTAATREFAAMPPSLGAAEQLLGFNDEVLAQGEALARAHEFAGAPEFAALVGPHLRHIVEHYEALVLRPFTSEVDYDARPRDRSLEHSPKLARERFAALRTALAQSDEDGLDDALVVFTLGGLAGQWPMATASTVSRELVFLASHAVHHFALLREHCARHGLDMPPHFGIAPATVAHARKRH